MADTRRQQRDDKMLGEWFWVDRWVGSRGFLLPLEARGLYREMLSAAWIRGAQLPADPDVIRRATGVSLVEWRRCWPLVKPFWVRRNGVLINETQAQIYSVCKSRRDGARLHAVTAARARHRGKHPE